MMVRAIASTAIRAHATFVVLGTVLGAGCPGPERPRVPPAAPMTVVIGRDEASLRGVAADGAHVYAALTKDTTTTIEAHRGSTRAWARDVGGTGGPIAVGGGQVFAALAGTDTVAGGGIRGEPGAAIIALDTKTGTVAWRLALDAGEWVSISAIAAAPDGAIVGGTFSGSLRARDRVVASGGKSDGFVAKVIATGQVAWLVRMGAGGADAIQGVATSGSRIAIAGTFTAGADLLGTPLPPFDERSPYPDCFVAELDANGARRWSAAFGGKDAESVAGVAIDAAGDVVVAANVRGELHVGGSDLVASGPADGVVARWTRDGTAGHAVLVGGPDFDGLRAVTAVGDRIVVGGFFSGEMRLGDRTITASGGDDAFLAEYDRSGAVIDQWPASGQGREEITALSSLPGGFVAGVAYTAAANIAGNDLAAPADPMSGAVIVVRPVR